MSYEVNFHCPHIHESFVAELAVMVVVLHVNSPFVTVQRTLTGETSITQGTGHGWLPDSSRTHNSKPFLKVITCLGNTLLPVGKMQYAV